MLRRLPSSALPWPKYAGVAEGLPEQRRGTIRKSPISLYGASEREKEKKKATWGCSEGATGPAYPSPAKPGCLPGRLNDCVPLLRGVGELGESAEFPGGKIISIDIPWTLVSAPTPLVLPLLVVDTLTRGQSQSFPRDDRVLGRAQPDRPTRLLTRTDQFFGPVPDLD